MPAKDPVHAKHCSACGFRNRKQAKFCGDCGKILPDPGRSGFAGEAASYIVGLATVVGLSAMLILAKGKPENAEDRSSVTAPAPGVAAPAPSKKMIVKPVDGSLSYLQNDQQVLRVADESARLEDYSLSHLDRIDRGGPAYYPRDAAGINWVRIPGGSFMMGSDNADAKPRHQVSVVSFQIAKTEVTNGQYRACVEAGVCSPPGSYEGGEDRPVVHVDWNQAKTFSRWVGGRLPSEAEWERAARGGCEAERCLGDDARTLDEYAWHKSNSGGQSHPPCRKRPNQYGLCDMHGNVWEWTDDGYHGFYHGAPTDGSAWEGPAGSDRVYRGGSWDDTWMAADSSTRRHVDPLARRGHLGFRTAR